MTASPPPTGPPVWKIAAVLCLGIAAVATAAIWVRLSIAAMPSAVRAASGFGLGFGSWFALARLTIAAVLLLPKWPAVLRSRREGRTVGAFGWAIAAGACLGLHFALWLSSLSYTSIAAATVLVTSNPLWIALLGWWCFGDRPTAWSFGGIGIALAGSAAIALSGAVPTAIAGQPALGNLLALLGAWAVSAYLLLGRTAQRRGLTLAEYSTIAYASAATLLLPVPALFGASYTAYPLPVFGYVLLSALLPQLVGHTAINWSVRWVSPTIVTLAVLFEPLISTTLGIWMFDEVPSPTMAIGAIVMLGGVVLAIVAQPRRV
ncbi:MAG: DMT family transporter [Geitlerinemataceae cyanobacterium]